MAAVPNYRFGYVVCYSVTGGGTPTKNIEVLLGRKKFVQTRDHTNGGAARAMTQFRSYVINSGGMAVFPGGGINANTDVGGINGALTEFYEETNIQFTLVGPANTTVTGPAALGAAAFNIHTRHYAAYPGAEYFVVYIDVGLANLRHTLVGGGPLCQLVNANIAIPWSVAAAAATCCVSDELAAVTVSGIISLPQCDTAVAYTTQTSRGVLVAANPFDLKVLIAGIPVCCDTATMDAFLAAYTPPLVPNALVQWCCPEVQWSNLNLVPFIVFCVTNQWTKTPGLTANPYVPAVATTNATNALVACLSTAMTHMTVGGAGLVPVPPSAAVPGPAPPNAPAPAYNAYIVAAFQEAITGALQAAVSARYAMAPGLAYRYLAANMRTLLDAAAPGAANAAVAALIPVVTLAVVTQANLAPPTLIANNGGSVALAALPALGAANRLNTEKFATDWTMNMCSELYLLA